MASRLQQHVVEQMGRQIVSGELRGGTTILGGQVEQEFGVSRSTAREGVRVLQSVGLVSVVQRQGITVQDRAHWRVWDPLVIRWRLAGADRNAQLRSLTEMRSAVEPAAAALTAEYASDALRAQLVELADEMTEIGNAGDLPRFLELDIEFHSAILHGSGNELFGAVDSVIAEVLEARTSMGLMPDHPHPDALGLHRQVAAAISNRDATAARDGMADILARTFAEMEPLWESVPRD